MWTCNKTTTINGQQNTLLVPFRVLVKEWDDEYGTWNGDADVLSLRLHTVISFCSFFTIGSREN